MTEKRKAFRIAGSSKPLTVRQTFDKYNLSAADSNAIGKFLKYGLSKEVRRYLVFRGKSVGQWKIVVLSEGKTKSTKSDSRRKVAKPKSAHTGQKQVRTKEHKGKRQWRKK
jgi:hypothetical protein